MTNLPLMVFEIQRVDALAQKTSLIHDLDPRAKLLTTSIYIAVILSFERFTISAFLPFFIYPIILIFVADLPMRYILRRLLMVAPFVVLIGIANPLIETQPLFIFGSITISEGWVSFTSIMLRFVLTVASAIVLIATTSFHGICLALYRLGLPSIMVLQLLMLQRYIIILTEEVVRMVGARALRSFRGQGLGIKSTASLIGHLLLRTVDRAHRIYLAMLARGFDGTIRLPKRLSIGRVDILFTLGWSSLFIILRFVNFSQLLGAFIIRVVG